MLDIVHWGKGGGIGWWAGQTLTVHDLNIVVGNEIPCHIPVLLDNCCEPLQVGCPRFCQLCLPGRVIGGGSNTYSGDVVDPGLLNWASNIYLRMAAMTAIALVVTTGC